MSDRKFTVIENTFITLDDGTRLAARIWMPDGTDADPVPAVFEFLPYRKGDGTCSRMRRPIQNLPRPGSPVSGLISGDRVNLMV